MDFSKAAAQSLASSAVLAAKVSLLLGLLDELLLSGGGTRSKYRCWSDFF